MSPLLCIVGFGLDRRLRLGAFGLRRLGFGLGVDVLIRLLLLPFLVDRSVLGDLFVGVVLVVRKLPEHDAVSVARPRLVPAHHHRGPFELPRHASHPARELRQHVDQRPERQTHPAHGADGGPPDALVRSVDNLGRRRRDVQQEVLGLDQPAGRDEARASVDVDGQVLLLDVESLVVKRPGEGDLGFRPSSGLHLRLASQPVQRGQSPVDAHGVLASCGANHPPGPALRQRLLAVVDELAGDGDLPLQVSRVLEEVQQHVVEGLLHPVVVRPRRPVPHDRRRGLRVRTHLLQDAHQVFEGALRRLALRLNLLNHQVSRLREVLEGELRVFRASVGGGRAGPRAREAAAGRRAKRWAPRVRRTVGFVSVGGGGSRAPRFRLASTAVRFGKLVRPASRARGPAAVAVARELRVVEGRRGGVHRPTHARGARRTVRPRRRRELRRVHLGEGLPLEVGLRLLRPARRARHRVVHPARRRVHHPERRRRRDGIRAPHSVRAPRAVLRRITRVGVG